MKQFVFPSAPYFGQILYFLFRLSLRLLSRASLREALRIMGSRVERKSVSLLP